MLNTGGHEGRPYRSTALLVGVLLPLSLQAQAPPAPRTTVVVLGVTHSLQLLNEAQQPGAFLAFFGRVNPTALAIELTPERYSRNNSHEFTYEIQNLAIPWAREQRVALYPFDWEPDPEDERLAFGQSWEPPPLIRTRGRFHYFQTFTDSADLRRSFFYADSAAARNEYSTWYDSAAAPEIDFARRLFLYRTSLQAVRIRNAARNHRGGTLLVVVGSFHKDQIERILQADSTMQVVQPATFGYPSADEIARATQPVHLAAIARFTLLGLQSTAPVDKAWRATVVRRLAQSSPSAESDLYAVRLAVLDSGLAGEAAISRYEAIRRRAGSLAFSWSGQVDRSRLDSYIDPFAALSVAQRAALESAREMVRLGRAADAARVREELLAALREPMRSQFVAYWTAFIGAGL